MTIKILGQAVSVAETVVDLYTVPAGKECVISTLALANREAAAGTITVYVRKSGESTDPKQIIVPASQVAANDAKYLTIGITLAAGDSIAILSPSANFSASLFGNERLAT